MTTLTKARRKALCTKVFRAQCVRSNERGAVYGLLALAAMERQHGHKDSAHLILMDVRLSRGLAVRPLRLTDAV